MKKQQNLITQPNKQAWRKSNKNKGQPHVNKRISTTYPFFIPFLFPTFTSFRYFLLFWRAWPRRVFTSFLWPFNCGAAALTCFQITKETNTMFYSFQIFSTFDYKKISFSSGPPKMHKSIFFLLLSRLTSTHTFAVFK